MLVSLTDAGREAADQERGGAEIYEGFSDEEREALGAYLDRIIENLEKISADFEDDTDQQRWESAARERMGDERFEEWLARAEQMGMRGGRRFDRRSGGPHQERAFRQGFSRR